MDGARGVEQFHLSCGWTGSCIDERAIDPDVVEEKDLSPWVLGEIVLSFGESNNSYTIPIPSWTVREVVPLKISCKKPDALEPSMLDALMVTADQIQNLSLRAVFFQIRYIAPFKTSVEQPEESIISRKRSINYRYEAIPLDPLPPLERERWYQICINASPDLTKNKARLLLQGKDAFLENPPKDGRPQKGDFFPRFS